MCSAAAPTPDSSTDVTIPRINPLIRLMLGWFCCRYIVTQMRMYKKTGTKRPARVVNKTAKTVLCASSVSNHSRRRKYILRTDQWIGWMDGCGSVQGPGFILAGGS